MQNIYIVKYLNTEYNKIILKDFISKLVSIYIEVYFIRYTLTIITVLALTAVYLYI